MPDSERDPQATKKPAKKAAKKAAKKTAKRPAAKRAAIKKAVEAPLSSQGEEALGDTPATPADVIAMVGKTLDEITRNAKGEGLPVLYGAASVQLIMQMDNASDPLDAVEQFINQVTERGLRTWAYIVRDDITGENYMVHHGLIVPITEESGDATA